MLWHQEVDSVTNVYTMELCEVTALFGISLEMDIQIPWDSSTPYILVEVDNMYYGGNIIHYIMKSLFKHCGSHAILSEIIATSITWG